MRKIKYIIGVVFMIMSVLAPAARSWATINSITLTPGSPTVLSTGLGYYLGSITYNFTINVKDPDITGWGQITDVRITIPNSTNAVIFIDPSGTGVNLPVTVSSGTVNAVADVSGTFNDCTVTFKVTVRWDTEQSNWTAARNVVASATTSLPAVNTLTDTKTLSYGVCSTVRIFNFSQGGDAADGFISPYHQTFNITGAIVYNVPGAALSDKVNAVRGAAEIASATLLIDGAAAAGIAVDNAFDLNPATEDLSFAIPLEHFFNQSIAPGNHTWSVQAIMTVPGSPKTSANTITINCDEVEITAITFFNGGGVDASPYYRSTNVPGTQVRVTARMRNSLGSMVGNTTVTMRKFNPGPNQDIPLVIANGATQGITNLPNLNTLPAAGATDPNTYQITSIAGGAYDSGQNAAGRIVQPANPVINWDNADPPGANSAPFTPWLGLSQTAYSLTFNWTPLTAGAPDLDGDFYSYKVYYRTTGPPVGSWYIIDRNTTGYAALGAIGTGTTTITGLIPLTSYDFYITAVDVFGQEVPLVNSVPSGAAFTTSTLASTIAMTISDGITTYDDNSFTSSALASARPLRKSAVRVGAFIVAAGELPDIVNIIVAQDPGVPLVAGGVLVGVQGTDYYRYTTLKTGANSWTGYIPTTNPLMTTGTSIKFILETIKGGANTYADHDSESESPPGDPNNRPWNFIISIPTTFKPWPVRILNNVITDKNPVAYPSYYLSDDAFVTIDVYDIKGRPLVTLLDNAYRRGGQNIKEEGWRGDNKARRKVGVGLYYIRIEAKRVSDGKTILNSFQKVVMAK